MPEFQVGDIITSGGSPSYLEVVHLHGPYGNPVRIRARGYSAGTARHAYFDYYVQGVLVAYRPGVTEGEPPPREEHTAPLWMGAEGAFPDMEFCRDIAAQHLAAREAGGVYRADEFRADLLNFLLWQVPGVADRGMSYWESREGAPRSHAALGALYSVEDATELFALKWFSYLMQIFQRLDPATERCLPCAIAAGGQPRLRSNCSHFTCSQCSASAITHCGICEGLQGFPNICTDCCTHTRCTCAACHGSSSSAFRRSAACPDCTYNPRCCRCATLPRCEYCNRRTRKAEDCCGGCAECCQCDDHCMRLIPGRGGHTTRDLHKFHAPEGESGMTRLLGAEIETARADSFSPLMREAVKRWRTSIVEDGSIGDDGVEVVTQPAGGSQWVAMIADLGRGFVESNAATSEKCGLHIHVDAGDLGAPHLRRLIRLYAHLEGALFDMLPISRLESRFCRPCGPDYLAWLSGEKRLTKLDLGLRQYGIRMPNPGQDVLHPRSGRYVKAESLSKNALDRHVKRQLQVATEGKYHNTRYKALNLHSYWHRGTVEFRHHHGTNDPVKITNWGILVGTIADVAARKKDSGIDRLLAQPARDVILKGLGLSPEVTDYVASRWALFTSAPGLRRHPQPEPDDGGEV